MAARYRSYAAYLRERYGGRAARVSVDAGLGCPHRPGGGCIFCEDRAPAVRPAPVEAQIRRRLDRLGGHATLLLYFQGGSGTHGSPDRLRALYDRALSLADFRELIVGTRPDCVDPARASLLGSYVRPGFDVWVELGLQSAHDRTLSLLSRGHDAGQFRSALELVRARGVRVAAHLIHGLPGESLDDFLGTVEWVAAQDPDGIKIHNLHVLRGTPLGELYLRGEVTAPSAPAHIAAVSRALELLSPRAVVIRVTTDSDAKSLLAPRGFPDKSRFLRDLDETMERLDMRQGARRAAAGSGAQP